MDVIRTLGLTEGGATSRNPANLDGEEVKHISQSNVGQVDVSFPNRGANCVSESGLYKLVLRSEKPEAKEFQDHVTKVILPAIRKEGAYIEGKEKSPPGR